MAKKKANTSILKAFALLTLNPGFVIRVKLNDGISSGRGVYTGENPEVKFLAPKPCHRYTSSATCRKMVDAGLAEVQEIHGMNRGEMLLEYTLK